MEKLIIFLIIVMSTSQLTGILKESGISTTDRAILYVGGSGPGNYSNIQDAIDDAFDGDTIKVYDGTYYETVTVNKRISLIGNGSMSTIIDGGYADHQHVIYITASKVKISGFGVRNSYMGHEFGGIGIQSSNNIIFDNHCWNNLYGAILFSGQNTLYNNSFSNNKRDGIFVKSSGNIIDNNNCSHSSEDDGIWLYICTDNIISNNTCSNNYMNGISLYQSYNNQILNNRCNKSSIYDGIFIYESSNNEFRNNKLSSNNGEGIGISHVSDNNTIILNNISSNNDGIELKDNSKDNVIKSNIIFSNNGYGIKISSSSNNSVYHNNLDTNTQNAFDNGHNIWDNGYPSGGNYWNDYIGKDDNHDGIGETTYNISGGNNQDEYPLMNPWGENPPVTHFSYNIDILKVMFNGSSSYDRDGEIVSYDWDFGDSTNGTGMIVSHDYSDVGTYDVTLTVTDNDGFEDDVTKSVVLTNQQPDTPVINGPNSGKSGKSYSYNFVAEDPNGDDVYYEIDWGEGSVEPWDGPHNSNVVISRDHSWDEKGSFTIMARAKDAYGLIGEWGTFDVTMPKNRIFNIWWFTWLLDRFPLLNQLFDILERLMR